MGFAALLFFDGEGRTDQADVCECLGKISQSITTDRVSLFGKQAQVVSIFQERLQSITGLLQRSAPQREILNSPKSANAEGSFRRLSSITI